ncbi:MAG: hypothetical protein Q9182_004803 [Xanthomendoza sp. 2 TL-2023]
MIPCSVTQLAFPAVISLIAFLAYTPQYLFRYIEPGPLDQKQSLIFNLLLSCIWFCYGRACFTDPGHVPRDWPGNNDGLRQSSKSDTGIHGNNLRWCRKCECFKPPRAHHCKYLGPTPTHLTLLFTLTLTNTTTLFALSIFLLKTTYTLSTNTTAIETWEIDRHDTLVRRARKHNGYLDGPDGVRVRIQRQEFPYDVGVYRNLRQGMGTVPVTWLWPFAATPTNEAGWGFEVNGFEGL